MNRRELLKTGLAGAALFGAGACSSLSGLRRAPAPWRRPAHLVPVDVSLDRVIRTTVGLRPFRDSGFVLRADKLDDCMLIHNYGHGGAGMSLSWGTAHQAAELALQHTARDAAVIGCGVVGLTTARMLQRRGFAVTIYARALPPETTSNMSWASFTPTSGLVSPQRRTAAWDEQFRQAVGIAYRELQLLVGRRIGLSWIDDYGPMQNLPAGTTALENGRAIDARNNGGDPLLSDGMILGNEILSPGQHPFATRYARRRPALKFEPSVYLEALMRDVLAFGGRIVVRNFDTPRDLVALPERLIVNCTGLGSKQLFGDEELTPVRGQLVILAPQWEVNYMAGAMLPRGDGIALGHTMERGVWSLEVDEVARDRVLEQNLRMFRSMRGPDLILRVPTESAPAQTPPVESFFDRES